MVVGLARAGSWCLSALRTKGRRRLTGRKDGGCCSSAEEDRLPESMTNQRHRAECADSRVGAAVSEGPAIQDRLDLAAIVEALAEPVLTNTLDGTIHSWNLGAEQLYGYRADEVVGKKVTMLVPPERRAESEEILARVRRGEEIRQLETVRRRKDGSDVDVSVNITPIRSASGEIIGASAVQHDISERKRREDIQSFLVEASRLLTANLDHHESLPEIAALALLRVADGCVVEIADADGGLTQAAVAHREPAKAELMREMRRLYPVGAGSSAIPSRVLRTGKAELIPDVSDKLLENVAQNADHLRMLRTFDASSMIVVPLELRGRAIGTIMLANTASSRRFGLEDLELAEDLARRASLAIENATLYESEQEARRKAERAAERLGRLQAVTAALSAAVTPAAVAAVFVRQGAAAAGADGGFIRLPTPSRTLELQATVGYSRRFRKKYKQLPQASALPGAEVFRTGLACYFESAADAAAAPEFACEHKAMGHEAIAFIPLSALDGPIGVMALSFAEARAFDGDDRDLLKALADQCAQALERARLYESEQTARAAADLYADRTARLQTLAAELADALTPVQVAEVVVAQGMASVGADKSALYVLGRDSKLLEVVTGPDADASVGETWERLSTTLKLPATDALRTLEPVFIESEQELDEMYPLVESGNGEGGRFLRRARAGAHVPLVVSGRPLGVLFLGFDRPRPFSESQRSFVLALGRQCAQALRRAQLYETELEERSELSRLVERLRDGVVSVRRHGHVDFASSRARELLSGTSLAEGKQLPATWRGFPLRRFATELFEVDASAEAQVAAADGEHVFELTGIPPAGSDMALIVIADVTEREQRRRVEREFVDNAAHELRTPLAAITGAIERLQAGARDVPEKRDRFLGHIEHESARLNRLAASLLVLARVQTRREEPLREQIALRPLLVDLLDGVELRRGVELTLDCPSDLIVQSNRDLLEHALLNLVSNAANHTDAGEIRVAAHTSADGSVTIEVADTGSGIQPEEFARLFDRFYRGPRDGERSGSGLGLPITKEAVEAVGGRVEIDSVPDEGTTARILLPGTTRSEAS